MACLNSYCRAVIYFGSMLTSSWASAAICNATMQGLTGSYVVGNQSTESTGTINIDCDSISSYTFALSEGDTETFLETKRRAGTHHLSYKVSTDGVHTIIREDGKSSGDPAARPNHILSQCIPLRQSELPSKEAPTITVMISF
jgi:spore coat protein U-like protein